MITFAMVIGLLALLGGGFFWAVRAGKKMQRLDDIEDTIEKTGNVNEFNRKLDEEIQEKISAGDDPVRFPWLRKHK